MRKRKTIFRCQWKTLKNKRCKNKGVATVGGRTGKVIVCQLHYDLYHGGRGPGGE